MTVEQPALMKKVTSNTMLPSREMTNVRDEEGNLEQNFSRAKRSLGDWYDDDSSNELPVFEIDPLDKRIALPTNNDAESFPKQELSAFSVALSNLNGYLLRHQLEQKNKGTKDKMRQINFSQLLRGA